MIRVLELTIQIPSRPNLGNEKFKSYRQIQIWSIFDLFLIDFDQILYLKIEKDDINVN